MARRRRKHAPKPSNPPRATLAKPLNVAARPAAGRSLRARDEDTRGLFAGVVACFFLSGFAGLLYQTAWLRQLSLVFGTSELAVAAVLAAYMAGLAIGAAVAVRYVQQVRRPILAYGLLEAGIALSALAVPVLLSFAGTLYGWALGNRPEPPGAASLAQPLFHLGVAFLVLAIPTGLMGATLPLLTRHAVRTDSDVGPRVASLYLANTAGAVLGTLATGFALLPALGLTKTVWVGVAANALVFAIAAALSRRAPVLAVGPALEERVGAGEPPIATRAAWILPVMLVSGAVAFAYEVLWTRLLAHVLGGSVSAFSTMLAAFLTGIALGGGLAGRVAGGRTRAATAFAATQLAIGFLSMLVYCWMVTRVPEGRQMASLVAYAIAVMVPATLFIGATFPLAVRILARDEREASAVTARVYAWNTVGAIGGAILAGFWLVPGLGFEGTLKLAVCVNLGLALISLACLVQPRWVALGAVALALLCVALLYHPARPQALIARTSFGVDLGEPLGQVFYAVGRSSTVVVQEVAGGYYLLTNGLPEAKIAAPGRPPDQDVQKWLTALAVVARPDIGSMLVIGYGGGVALEGVPASVSRIDVIEIEPEVIEANRSLAGRRDRDPLKDPRVRVIINDARNALRLTHKRYDAIVSQPSHPWTAGASHLFTREFFRSAKQHLSPAGVFVQWMNPEFVTEPLLRSLSATLLAEFRYARLYRPSSTTMHFLASDAPLDVELEVARTGRPLRDDPMHFSRLGVSSVEDLLAALALDQRGLEEFARGAPAATDDHNLMATQSRSRADGLTSRQVARRLAPYDPLANADPWLRTLGDSTNLAYLAKRIVALSGTGRASKVKALTTDESTRLLIDAELYAQAGEMRESRKAAQAAVSAQPRNQQALYQMVRSNLAVLADGNGVEHDALAGLEGSARAAVQGWRFSLANDWRSLAGLDPELSRSRPTDLWFSDAAVLRAQHRIELQRESRPAMLEALQLIDSALIASQDFNLYMRRAVVGIFLGDRNVFVESARRAVETVMRRLKRAAKSHAPLDPGERAGFLENLRLLTRELGRDRSDENGRRAAAVRAAAQRAIERLEENADRPASPPA
jgi:spermidine synthase